MKAEYKPYVEELIELAIKEDIGDGDHTSLCCIPAEERGRMRLLCKQEGIIAGIEVAKMVTERLDSEVKFEQILNDGDRVKVGDVAFYVEGNLQSLLRAERILLNIMQRMSGVATQTAVYADRNGCMDHPGNFFMIFRADIPGGNGVHSGTESIEKDYQHDIQCGTRSHCRSGNGTDFLRSELTEDDKICRIKKQTDDTGPHQRERETENLAEKRAMTHIDLIFFIAVHCKMPCFFIFG